MTVTINAATSTGLAVSSDGSGIVKLQSNGVTTNALAWVNFNGTGTVAIRASYNVSSITDNGTGDYTINFTNALPDINYSAVGGVGNASGGGFAIYMPWMQTPTTTALRVGVYNGNSTAATDCLYTQVAFFGN